MHVVTDATLGKLGRHLRAAGFDTQFFMPAPNVSGFTGLELITTE